MVEVFGDPTARAEAAREKARRERERGRRKNVKSAISAVKHLEKAAELQEGIRRVNQESDTRARRLEEKAGRLRGKDPPKDKWIAGSIKEPGSLTAWVEDNEGTAGFDQKGDIKLDKAMVLAEEENNVHRERQIREAETLRRVRNRRRKGGGGGRRGRLNSVR